jgi:TPR repeat protein
LSFIAAICHYGRALFGWGADVKQRVRAVFASGLLTLALLGAAIAGPFEDGVGALQRQDNATAIRLLLPLAQMGNAEAQFYVAIAYNTVKDYRQGAKWYRKSADQGYYAAQFDLGTMYDLGQGVPQDYVLAYMWLSLATSISSPYDFMIKRRDGVASKMTPGQIAEAQRMAREWMAK